MPRIVPTLFGFFLLGALAVAACNRNPGGAPGAGPGGPGGGPPPMPVETVTLAEKPLERTSEYIASLKSRRSSTIQPQVEGFLTRIAVRSGDRVGQGTVLFEVDSGPQQAAVATLESTRAQRDAELSYATQELARTKALYAAGAVSQRELAQAETASRTAEAALRAVDEQIRQQKTELAYYRVTSPTAGTVGDIPVRPGDRVTKTTVLTTVDENDVLEIYVNVPVQQAADLKLGLPIRIEDDRGNVLATNKITFISPNVEPTQTVLAKATLVDGRGSFRSDQLVRARIVWRAEPGLSVPLTAVTRINGQYFAYVVEKEGDKTVARQKGVTLGPLTGNDYLVLDGLKPGEQLITAGIQKIRDGAPVMVGGPPAGAPGQQKAS
ncbi:MAG TPA: efflux RND transporter periplasmic adaptor subunit [Vicinamibacterales bacterium]|nr:efflux RND transporter periplasmic adaptor subunit [Vicinamibacterales bacterium]